MIPRIPEIVSFLRLLSCFLFWLNSFAFGRESAWTRLRPEKFEYFRPQIAELSFLGFQKKNFERAFIELRPDSSLGLRNFQCLSFRCPSLCIERLKLLSQRFKFKLLEPSLWINEGTSFKEDLLEEFFGVSSKILISKRLVNRAAWEDAFHHGCPVPDTNFNWLICLAKICLIEAKVTPIFPSGKSTFLEHFWWSQKNF